MKKLCSLIIAAAMVLSLAACGSSADSSAASEAAAAESKAEAAVSEAVEAASTAAESIAETAEASVPADASGETHSIGFSMIGMGNEFFEAIIAAYQAKMESLGWDASYISAEFDVSKQIESIENYTANGVDVLVVFPVNGQAVSDAVSKARAAGVKVIVMVDETSEWDVFLSSDNLTTGYATAWLAAQFIEDHYADAEPGSVPVAVIQIFDTPNDEQTSIGLEKITEYTDKVNVTKYEVAGQNVEDGQKAAETLYVTNPEIKLFICTSNQICLGIDNYYTGLNSPIDPSELADYGAWGTNASEEVLNAILESGEDKSLVRGINIQAGIQETADDIAELAQGLVDGTIDHVEAPANVYLVTADNIQEYFQYQKTALMWDYANAIAFENPIEG